MKRRDLLLGAFALATAPTLVAAQPATMVLWGDGLHDDTAALQALLRGDPVRWASGEPFNGHLLAGKSFLLSRPIAFDSRGPVRRVENCRFAWNKA